MYSHMPVCKGVSRAYSLAMQQHKAWGSKHTCQSHFTILKLTFSVICTSCFSQLRASYETLIWLSCVSSVYIFMQWVWRKPGSDKYQIITQQLPLANINMFAYIQAADDAHPADKSYNHPQHNKVMETHECSHFYLPKADSVHRSGATINPTSSMKILAC